MVVRSALLALAIAALPGQNLASAQDETRGSDFVKPIECQDTRITKITDRFGQKLGSLDPNVHMASGTQVTFANGAGVVSYDVNHIVALENVGDRVQVCFLGRIEGTQSCITAIDKRGKIYRVYDYKLHVAYTMMNSQHTCGGA